MKPSPGGDQTSALLREMVDLLTAIGSGLRQTDADRLWSSIPQFVEEYGAIQSGTLLQLAPEFGGLVLITDVVASVPAGATGALTLGPRVIFLGEGNTSFGTQIVLAATDTRALEVTAAGPVSLHLAGRQLPTTGVLSN